MEHKNIEKFTMNKRRFVYINLSGMSSNDELASFFAAARDYIKDFKNSSLYMITNVEGMVYDTATKDILADWFRFCEDYVIHGVIIHMDGVKKIMFKNVFESINSSNAVFMHSRQQAVDYLSEV